MKKVVVVGGGTGSHTVLSGLKKYPIDLSAIVTVADSGGSTGRLRDEFGYLPVGDFRMALVALADTELESELLRKLFLYRFDKGEKGLRGHNFGNLFLVAMADLLGSYDKAIESVAKIMRVKGRVIPVSSKKIDIAASYEDGTSLKGEARIDEPPAGHNGKQRIVDFWIEPKAAITNEATDAILDADLIVFGPGDLYTSILANIVVDGAKNAVKKSGAKVVYVVNLMTKYGQTYGFTARDHVKELAKYIDRYPDFVLVNDSPLPKSILGRYEDEMDFPVRDDFGMEDDCMVIRADLLAPREIKRKSGDKVKRSLIRHDSDKLAWEILKILNEAG